MSESLSWMQTGDTLALSGELDQDVLLPLWEIREEAVKGITSIDLSRVSRVDTGGLALLLHLIDLAKKQGNNVTLQGVNDKVYTLAILEQPISLASSGWLILCSFIKSARRTLDGAGMTTVPA